MKPILPISVIDKIQFNLKLNRNSASFGCIFSSPQYYIIVLYIISCVCLCQVVNIHLLK